MPDPTVTYLYETPPTLEEAQKIVGGYVEMIYLPDGRQMLVDEDGLSKYLARNLLASVVAGRPIVGRALILSDTAKWH